MKFVLKGKGTDLKSQDVEAYYNRAIKKSGQTLNKKNKFEYLVFLSNKINTKDFISEFFIPSTDFPFACNSYF